MSVRQDEKMELAKVLDCVPILFIETLEEANAKILLHAYISQQKLEGLSLSSHMVYTTQVCSCFSMISDTLVAQRPSTLYKYKKRSYKASQGTIQEAGNGGREEE